MPRTIFVVTLQVSLCWLAPQAAQAADGANLNVIGFSADMRYFAFEQYGIEDGSGFPYSEVFVLDLERNAWVKSSPIRERSENDEARLGAVRAASASKATPLLKSLFIDEPAEILASNQATEVLADRNHVQFDRWFRSSSLGSKPETNGSANEGRYELSVEANPMALPSNCTPENGLTYGFTLKLRSFKTGATSVLHKDDAIPASRRCPKGYDIQAIVVTTGYPKIDRLVAIIGVYSFGFEGNDRRFIAIPFTIDPGS